MDVECEVCGAKPFEPCVYVAHQHTIARGVVGKPIKRRNGRPYYHPERSWAYHVFDMACWNDRGRLKEWLLNYAGILAGTLNDSD